MARGRTAWMTSEIAPVAPLPNLVCWADSANSKDPFFVVWGHSRRVLKTQRSAHPAKVLNDAKLNS